MRLATIVVLAATLAACGKKPPTAPMPEAIGAELATFPQLLVPISSQTWVSIRAAIKDNDSSRSEAGQYPQPYAHDTVAVGGRSTSVFVAYTGVWLAPARVPLQAMSVQQYLRMFMIDPGADLAGVVAPKGNIFFTREQLPAVMDSASKAGAGSADLPYSVVHGAGR